MKARQWLPYVAVAGLALLVYIPDRAGYGAGVGLLPDHIEFNWHIRPILSDNCFQCHGPDAGNRKGDLRLDTFEGATADLGGYQAVSPSDVGNSELIARITHADAAERMPPEKAHKILTATDIAMLMQWVDEGAKWQEHWSFEPIEKREPPQPGLTGRVHNPIDAFILARLAAKGLKPSAEAERRKLIRRASLDLTGLPATIDEVEAFVEDPSEDAYEKLVERLLGSPGFGIHRAQFWLDAARYADTHGFHRDNFRSIWPYRDWVVDAFNNNMPFDQFTVVQLAGDMLPEASISQRVATGFNRSNPTTNEGGIIDEEYRAIYAADQANTTAAVWMGMTIGCAGCHDHKFDPLTQREYYQFTAFFRNTTQPARDGDSRDSRPFLILTPPSEIQRREEIVAEIEILLARTVINDQDQPSAVLDWFARHGDLRGNIPVAATSLEFHAPLNEGKGANISGKGAAGEWQSGIEGGYRWIDGPSGKALAVTDLTTMKLDKLANFNLGDSFSVSLWVNLPGKRAPINPLIGRFALDESEQGWMVSVTGNGVLRLKLAGDAVNTFIGRLDRKLEKQTWQHVVLTYNGSGLSRGFNANVNGEPVKIFSKSAVVNFAEFEDLPELDRGLVFGGVTADDIRKREEGEDTSATMSQAAERFVGLQDLRVYRGVLNQAEISLLYAAPRLRKLSGKASATLEKHEKALIAAYHTSEVSIEGQAVSQQVRALQNELAAIDRRSSVTLVMEEKPDSAAMAHILQRGQYDSPGDEVAAGVPAFLSMESQLPVNNRLALARWLVNPDHPLTARVAVNRFWQELFGTGIVKTAEDFGSQGEPPSHPYLIDWLAREFIDSGWDVKHMYRLMVLSATYRQDSVVRHELREHDPLNRLLARGPRFRLGAEAIRDQALMVSGLLNREMGGEPVKPYQPDGLWRAVAYIDSNTLNYRQDHGEKLYRRSLYTFRKRTAGPPSMTIFDAADRESCSMRRQVTNTPLQALLLLNDPQYVEAARHLAQQAIQRDQPIDHMFRTALGRPPDQQAMAVLDETYRKVLESYREHPEAASELLNIGESAIQATDAQAELAAMTVVASQVMNLDEFITKQ